MLNAQRGNIEHRAETGRADLAFLFEQLAQAPGCAFAIEVTASDIAV
jgi:hypothetical protein